MQTKRTKHYRTTSIGFSREDWELLMAIAFGEVLGYAVEHNMRVAFLVRVQSLDHLRQEKERAVYGLMLAKQQEERAMRSSTSSRQSHAHSGKMRQTDTLEPRFVGREPEELDPWFAAREAAGRGGSDRDHYSSSDGNSRAGDSRDVSYGTNSEVAALLGSEVASGQDVRRRA